MKEEGYKGFGPYQHTQLWKTSDAKNPSKGYGVMIANVWYWYELWMDDARQHCSDNADKYTPANPNLAA